MTPPSRTYSSQAAADHRTPCTQLTWLRATIVGIVLVVAPLCVGGGKWLMDGQREVEHRLAANEATAAALCARIEERLRALEASQQRVERILEQLTAQKRSPEQ